MNRPFHLLALVAALAWAPAVRAQDLEEPVAAELRALVAGAASEGSPGGLLAVLRRGEPCFVQPFGLADVEQHRPVTRATVFYLASVAKPFTAACVLHAAEAGKLTLDEPITRRVPGLPASHAAVKLQHLLDHRSGIPDVYDLAIGLDLGREPLASNAAAISLLARLPRLDFTPGSRFRYSNSGYVLLAEALRTATGSTLPAYARTNLFAPLGMQSARYSGEPELAGLPCARGYRQDGSGWQPLENPSGLLGPGGLWASVDDLARWERAFFAGGFGTEKLRRRLATAPELVPGTASHPAFGPYGAGSMVGEDRGLAIVRAAGKAFGFSAEIVRYPDQELSIVVLTNADLGLDDLAEDAAGVVLRDELRSAPRAASAERTAPADLVRFGRFWREEDSGVLWVLSLRPERMVAASLGDWKFELAYAAPDRLVAQGTRAPAELRFEPASGPATRMIVRAGDAELARCRPLPFPPAEPPDAAEYAGTYALEELGAVITLEVSGGGLRIVQQRPLAEGPPFVLPPFNPLGEDFFACDAGAEMQFERDAEGEIASLRLDLNRAYGLVLERL